MLSNISRASCFATRPVMSSVRTSHTRTKGFTIAPAFNIKPVSRKGVVWSRASSPVVLKATGRPTLDDVDRLSRGEAAKRRGTGSRGVPHRLNQEEMQAFKLAKKRRFLMTKGTGTRRNRRLGNNNPAFNIFRQFCDVFTWPAVVIEKGTGSDKLDGVVVDTSPARLKDDSALQAEIVAVAELMGIEVEEEEEEEENESESMAERVFGSSVEPEEEEFTELETRIQDQGMVIKELKVSGLTNGDSEVKKEVEILLELKASLQGLNDRVELAKEDKEREVEDLMQKDKLRLEGPIWQIQPRCIKFDCPGGRLQARELAGFLADKYCVTTNKKGKRAQ